MIQWLLATRLGRMFGGVIAAVAILFGVYVHGRNEGSTDAKRKMVDRDRKDADDVRKRAADARGVDGDSVDRLRDHGRLRD